MHFKPCAVTRFDFQEKNLRGWIQKRRESEGRETYGDKFLSLEIPGNFFFIVSVESDC